MQKSSELFAGLAEKFSNIIRAKDTLKPAAELVKVPLQQSEWLGKQSGPIPDQQGHTGCIF